jgi:hypothetical protein
MGTFYVAVAGRDNEDKPYLWYDIDDENKDLVGLRLPPAADDYADALELSTGTRHPENDRSCMNVINYGNSNIMIAAAFKNLTKKGTDPITKALRAEGGVALGSVEVLDFSFTVSREAWGGRETAVTDPKRVTVMNVFWNPREGEPNEHFGAWGSDAATLWETCQHEEGQRLGGGRMKATQEQKKSGSEILYMPEKKDFVDFVVAGRKLKVECSMTLVLTQLDDTSVSWAQKFSKVTYIEPYEMIRITLEKVPNSGGNPYGGI